jgi:hypothetical protein
VNLGFLAQAKVGFVNFVKALKNNKMRKRFGTFDKIVYLCAKISKFEQNGVLFSPVFFATALDAGKCIYPDTVACGICLGNGDVA